MRGRVMALWSVAFLGSTPIGGPIAGAVAQYVGPRWGLGLGALACALATVLGVSVARRERAARRRVGLVPPRAVESVLATADAAR
jgi:MFS family permease